MENNNLLSDENYRKTMDNIKQQEDREWLAEELAKCENCHMHNCVRHDVFEEHEAPAGMSKDHKTFTCMKCFCVVVV